MHSIEYILVLVIVCSEACSALIEDTKYFPKITYIYIHISGVKKNHHFLAIRGTPFSILYICWPSEFLLGHSSLYRSYYFMKYTNGCEIVD